MPPSHNLKFLKKYIMGREIIAPRPTETVFPLSLMGFSENFPSFFFFGLVLICSSSKIWREKARPFLSFLDPLVAGSISAELGRNGQEGWKSMSAGLCNPKENLFNTIWSTL